MDMANIPNTAYYIFVAALFLAALLVGSLFIEYSFYLYNL
jgi:hypothetical protein